METEIYYILGILGLLVVGFAISRIMKSKEDGISEVDALAASVAATGGNPVVAAAAAAAVAVEGAGQVDVPAKTSDKRDLNNDGKVDAVEKSIAKHDAKSKTPAKRKPKQAKAQPKA
jgi:hypothetical protein